MRKKITIPGFCMVFSLLSFTTINRTESAHGKGLSAIIEKYHLKLATDQTRTSKRTFDSLDQLEIYLASRKKTVKATATGKVIETLNPTVSSDVASATLYGTSGSKSVSFHMANFLNDDFPPGLDLSWSDSNTSVSSSAGWNSSWPNKLYFMSYYYGHRNGMINAGRITVKGDYEEVFSYYGSVFVDMYELEVDGSVGDNYISINATYSMK